jgi:hypothetical protein
MSGGNFCGYPCPAPGMRHVMPIPAPAPAPGGGMWETRGFPHNAGILQVCGNARERHSAGCGSAGVWEQPVKSCAHCS